MRTYLITVFFIRLCFLLIKLLIERRYRVIFKFLIDIFNLSDVEHLQRRPLQLLFFLIHPRMLFNLCFDLLPANDRSLFLLLHFAKLNGLLFNNYRLLILHILHCLLEGHVVLFLNRWCGKERRLLRVVDGWRGKRRLLRGVVEELHEEARVEGGGSWRV